MIGKTRFNPQRRKFLITSLATGTGLSLGFHIAGCGKLEDATSASSNKPLTWTPPSHRFMPNAFVQIDSNNQITVVAKHLEMGQGSYTGLATLVAEEMDADWEQVRVIAAPVDATRYNNLFWGKTQATGGSTAMANSYLQMREAGATVRQLFINAAAKKWQVASDEITVEKSVLHHAASDKHAQYGELVEVARQMPMPTDVFLKDAHDFKLIGKTIPRVDNLAKVNGTAIFTQDVQLPDMQVAVVAHAPKFGSKVLRFDASRSMKISGVTQVVEIPTGVAVIASNTWSAIQGRKALSIEWDHSKAFTLGSEEILENYRVLADTPGAVALDRGDVDGALKNTTATIDTEIRFPYLAHAAMEPLNCVVSLRASSCEIWNGEQGHSRDQRAVAKLLGFQPQQVTIHTLFAGGSFGRRSNPHSDYVIEAVNIAKSIEGRVPIKLVWTREDDTQGGYYRPMYLHRLKASLDDNGYPACWLHRIVGQSILADAGTATPAKEKVDRLSVEGAANLPYDIPNIRVDLHSPGLPVPVQWWRSVGSTHTAFAVETFIDQLARKAKIDPLIYRRKLLRNQPRHLKVLNLAAEKADWDKPLKQGRGRGIAVHKSFNSYVAQVAEVTLLEQTRFKVNRVIIAVDCGIAVNPDIVRAQMEGGMGYGLAPALSSEITLVDGAVTQDNFDTYSVLRMDEMPEVEVYIVDSEEAPTGVGEPATPVIAPAVANALSAITGKIFHQLPLSLKPQQLKQS